MQAYIVVFDRNSFFISSKLYSDIKSFIDDNYVDEIHKDSMLFGDGRSTVLNNTMAIDFNKPSRSAKESKKKSKVSFSRPMETVCEESEHEDLSEMLQSIDESFSEMLLRKIDEKNLKDSECYKKANIDRKLFSKIRSDRLYRPSKNTALAFAVALELPLEETKDLLQKAGFALTHSSKSDIIIEYFITRGIYDLFTINDALFSFDQKLLGA